MGILMLATSSNSNFRIPGDVFEKAVLETYMTLLKEFRREGKLIFSSDIINSFNETLFTIVLGEFEKEKIEKGGSFNEILEDYDVGSAKNVVEASDLIVNRIILSQADLYGEILEVCTSRFKLSFFCDESSIGLTYDHDGAVPTMDGFYGIGAQTAIFRCMFNGTAYPFTRGANS